ncbi:acetylornithine transaminase [Methanosarcinales archaeon]|nr:MAG: acetylornithine transaminase [Methanosarcinales archaeon]
MKKLDIIEQEAAWIQPTYTRQPIVLVKGNGAYVWDAEGRKYLDFVAGIAVNNVGHCHPKVVDAIKRQAELLIHTSNLYFTEPQVVLARRLCEIAGMRKAFFCNSGAEAVEGAIKLAKRYTGKSKIIAARGSFHGRTAGSLSLTDSPKYQAPFMPLMPGVEFVPYNDVDTLAERIDDETAAVILEPVQGESGVNIPDDDYLKGVREICDEKEVLLIFDEVQTGFGRTGRWFGKDHADVLPDIMTLGKAIAGGLPMGAVLSSEGVEFAPGEHASTFGGGPLICSAAIATIEAIESEDLVRNSARMGEILLRKLRSLDLSIVREIRGRGLMIGMELEKAGAGIVDIFRESGVLINCTAETVLRFVPPLIIGEREISGLIQVFDERRDEIESV